MPALAPVAYFAVTVWVVVCLYLIMLHGLALNSNTQHFWAWIIACSMSLTHEMLVQQVMALLLKLVVLRKGTPLVPAREAPSLPSRGARPEGSETARQVRKQKADKRALPRRPPPVIT